jgi:hypothetical protein
MKHPLRLLFSIPAIALTVAVGVSAQGKEEQSAIPVTTTVAPAVSLTTPPTTVVPVTTTTVVALPEDFFIPTLDPEVPCQEWAQTALDAGWHWDLLPEILTIAHRESRCLNIIDGHKNFNGHDRGPLQINQVWLDEIEAKYGTWEVVNDPYYNFAWAWEMYIWFDANRGCGFDPWYKTYSCK